jgi:iron complex outermembrane receptor protein
VAATGLNQSSVVVRGLNNIFSGALLVLTDNRIARVPSLRFNAYNFISTIAQDIDRIEVVSGPGSALYGPNSASGVMHIITKAPFESAGTTVSLGAGQRDLFIGSFRHAGSVNRRIGYKISGQYYQGTDWESFDAAEPDSIQFFRTSSSGPRPVGDTIRNQRDFDIEKLSGDARIDFKIDHDASLIVNGGFNRESSIELTPLGAAQAVDWIYAFAQARFQYRELFVQGYVNGSDAGDTYLRRTGQLIIDKSRLWAGQIQHRSGVGERLSLIYGFDALLTRPNTGTTISGRNEEADNRRELGVYLQADAELSKHLRLVGAGRVDHDNKLPDPSFSPRAALIYQPTEDHNVRLTYNRAFSTPTDAHLHLDILQSINPFGVGIDLRAQGVSDRGFHWRIDDAGPQFRSPFAPLDPRELSATDFIEFNDPIFTNVMWGIGREAVITGYTDKLAECGLSDAAILDVVASLKAVTPGGVTDVNNTLKTFSLDTRSFQHSTVADIADVERLRPTITQTLEVGYKGVIADQLRVSVDLYWTEKHDFIGPLTVETPNVFLDAATLSSYLDGQFDSALSLPANDYHDSVLAQLDDPACGGNGNGSPVDELTNSFANGAGEIPFGTASPQESLDPKDVMLTYRNFADITLHGADLSLLYHLNQLWTLGGNYSYLSRNLFKKSSSRVHEVFLNAPKNKFALSIAYTNAGARLNVHTRLRYVDAFRMFSPFGDATVPSYVVTDFVVEWRLPNGSSLALNVRNLFNNKHIEFAGAPKIGRLAILRVSRSF